MSSLAVVLLFSWLAGLAAFVGGAIAHAESSRETKAKEEIVHGVVALGGGVLIAAVAFALIPEGISNLSPLALAVSMSAGGLLFCYLDVLLTRHEGKKAQFMAMLVDFIPEAISLGAVFGHDRRLGFLLASFIGAQNLPEGFNSFRELIASGSKPRYALWALLAASLLGPLSACAGFYFLSDHPKWNAAIMTFAGGGILYLIFQDIAPQARLNRHWAPPLGAVLGFLIGALGKQLIH